MMHWQRSMAKHPRRLEAGAVIVGLWLVAIATAPAAQTTGYLLAVGAAPLRFQPPAAAGRPAGWLPLPLPLPDERDTNVTALATNASALTATEATNNSGLPPPITVASPTPVAPPDTSRLSLPPLTESVPAATAVVDMQSVLNWLSPASTNAPAGNLLFPVFVPATPPRSSQAVYESR